MIQVLVDLANTPVFRGLYRPNQALVGARLDELILRTSDLIVVGLPARLHEVRFRLYDGWYDCEGVGTDLHGMVRGHVRQTYPTLRRRLRVFAEIAQSAVVSPDDCFVDTYRQQRGLSRYPVSISRTPTPACAAPLSCAVNELRTWFKGTCPHLSGCHATSQDVAGFGYQKLVDTTLVADAIWLASQKQMIAVVSEDEDVLPGLITARFYGSPVLWLGHTVAPRAPYSDLVRKHKIRYVQC